MATGQGSPSGVCVVPAALYGSYSRAIAGRRLLESVVLGMRS